MPDLGVSGPARRYALIVTLLVGLATVPTAVVLHAGRAALDDSDRLPSTTPLLCTGAGSPVVVVPDAGFSRGSPGEAPATPPAARHRAPASASVLPQQNIEVPVVPVIWRGSRPGWNGNGGTGHRTAGQGGTGPQATGQGGKGPQATGQGGTGPQATGQGGTGPQATGQGGQRGQVGQGGNVQGAGNQGGAGQSVGGQVGGSSASGRRGEADGWRGSARGHLRRQPLTARRQPQAVRREGHVRHTRHTGHDRQRGHRVQAGRHQPRGL